MASATPSVRPPPPPPPPLSKLATGIFLFPSFSASNPFVAIALSAARRSASSASSRRRPSLRFSSSSSSASASSSSSRVVLSFSPLCSLFKTSKLLMCRSFKQKFVTRFSLSFPIRTRRHKAEPLPKRRRDSPFFFFFFFRRLLLLSSLSLLLSARRPTTTRATWRPPTPTTTLETYALTRTSRHRLVRGGVQNLRVFFFFCEKRRKPRRRPPPPPATTTPRGRRRSNDVRDKDPSVFGRVIIIGVEFSAS